VRKQFLDSYRGEIIYIYSPVSVHWNILRREQVEDHEIRKGLSRASIGQCLWLLRTSQYRETMLKNVGSGETVPLESLPRFGATLLRASRRETQAVFAQFGLRLLTRGFDFRFVRRICG
jgi:hypothetical protein